MSAITVPLRDEDLVKIRELADEAGSTPEQWVQLQVEAILQKRPLSFDAAAEYVLKKNAELYRRLAL